MSYHRNYNQQTYLEGPENEALRLFIRKHRKKILIFLGVTVLLALVALVALVSFGYTVVMPVGTDAVQSAYPAKAQSAFAGAKDWILGIVSNTNFSQWIGLITQFN